MKLKMIVANIAARIQNFFEYAILLEWKIICISKLLIIKSQCRIKGKEKFQGEMAQAECITRHNVISFRINHINLLTLINEHRDKIKNYPKLCLANFT